ncbi:hypothetical protein [Cupriavidus sp. UYPR2.512]|uniref:hypothetical protein n=1 Tax=Cupriavidus sp. UYPR2.512 TaxID=1080187 RepID=UPI00056028AC|nr:hypothetical protein [Cupriavidus sp. UYPR2.512]UIF89010.1 hypothetical protein KAF44_27855 [Cupriavidus necator]
MTGKIVKDLGVQILGKCSEQIGQGHESQAKIEKRSSIGRRPACAKHPAQAGRRPLEPRHLSSVLGANCDFIWRLILGGLVLEDAALRHDELFLSGLHCALHINHDFVYLKVDGDADAISQGDIFAVVSNLLACVRAGNKGLAVPAAQEPVHFQRSIYGLVLLNPLNFENYNDAILRAALLRGARDTELHYVGNEQASARMFSVIRASVLGWPRGEGDALPEFLMAMATRRLRLSLVHAEELVRMVADADLPPYLKLIADKICVD